MGMPSRARVLDSWREWLEENEIDPLEPQCWCCFRPVRKPTSFKRLAKIDNPSWRKIRSAWNDCKGLHRCHIVSETLGGTDEPENIFMMCKKCHDSAPDTTSKEMFLRWVYVQEPHFAQEFAENWNQFNKTLRDFGVDSDEDIVELGKLVRSKKFKAWALKNIVTHFGAYGLTLKVSTMVAALLEYQKQLNRQNTKRNDQEQLRLPFNDQ